MEGCEGKPQPCWYGIVPGVTMVAKTQQILVGLGYTPSRRSSYGIITYDVMDHSIACKLQVIYYDSTGPIQSLEFRECSGVRFGDMSRMFGKIDWILPDLNRNTLIYEFGGDIDLDGGGLFAHSPVSHFSLWSNEGLYYHSPVHWKGFMRQARYCRQQFILHGSSGC